MKHVLTLLHSRRRRGQQGAGPTLGINSSKSEIIRVLNLAEIFGEDIFGALLSGAAKHVIFAN